MIALIMIAFTASPSFYLDRVPCYEYTEMQYQCIAKDSAKTCSFNSAGQLICKELTSA